MKIYIEAKHEGYAPEQCRKTMTVREMLDWLEQFDDDAEIYISNDNGYTYGSIQEQDFREGY